MLSRMFLITLYVTILIFSPLSFNPYFEEPKEEEILASAVNDVSSNKVVTARNEITPAPTVTPSPTVKPFAKNNLSLTSTPTLTPVPVEQNQTQGDSEWGVAKQIDENTWTMKVQNDSQMATPQEIFEALNNYRRTRGVGALSWADNLAQFAQERANKFKNDNKLDGHAGFNEYFQNQDNLKNIGYNGVGENSSIGYTMSGVHIIEWIFAGDAPHDNNQTNSKWQYVGIGVNGNAVDLVFGAVRI